MSRYNWGCSQPSIFPQYKIKFDWGNSLLMKSGILGTDTIVNILTIAHSWISIRLYREGFDLVHHYCSWVNYSRSWNFIVVFFFHHNSVYGIKMWLCCSLLKVIILIREVLDIHMCIRMSDRFYMHSTLLATTKVLSLNWSYIL